MRLRKTRFLAETYFHQKLNHFSASKLVELALEVQVIPERLPSVKFSAVCVEFSVGI